MSGVLRWVAMCPPLGAQRQVIRLAPWLGKAVTGQTWLEREEGRGGEGRRGRGEGRGGRGWAVITFTCPEPGPPVQLSLDLLLGLKGAGAKGRGAPPVTQVASFSKRMSSPPPQRSLTIHPLGVTDETNRKEKLL